MKPKPNRPKAKTKLKTVKSMGMKLTYHPSPENEAITKQVLEKVKATRKRRRAVAAAQAKVPPPDLTPTECLEHFK